MYLKHNLSILLFAFNIFVTYHVSCDDVPVVLWNIKGNSLHLKPISALGRDDTVLTDSLKDILQDDSSVVVFAMNKLSLEDFSASEESAAAPNNTLRNLEFFLDMQPHMLLPSVKDPLDVIHKAHCGVQEIVVDQSFDDSVLKSVTSAISRSCVVILHITDTGIVARKEQMRRVFLPTFEKGSKNVVGVFTAMKSSWGVSKDDHHIFRNLLAVEESTSKPENFLNVSGCLIMYGENATILVVKENKTAELSFPPDFNNSKCGTNTSLLLLNFENPSGEIKSVLLKFKFTTDASSWKTSASVKISGKGFSDDEIDLDSRFIYAPLGFSYSCGDVLLQNKNKTDLVPVKIHINRFQVQPFEVNYIFNDSFDCIPYFTIPIWMGIFVSILFIAILNCGIYALFSVHTMDRFDDPKGKTISVAAAAD